MDSRNASRRRIGVFFAALLALSSLFWTLAWLDASGAWTLGPRETRQWFVTGLMWCPGLAALVATGWARERPSLGLDLPQLHWLAVAAAWPVLYIAAAYALVWAGGFGGFDAGPLLEQAHKRYALTGVAAAVAAVLAPATLGVLAEIGRSLGEELGWRGFLAPAWVSRWGLEAGGLLSGLAWGLWHLPLFLAYGFGEEPATFAIACFLVAIVPLGYVCAWLRWRSGSVWPAVLLHSVHNALLYPVFDLCTAPVEGRTAYAAGETGFALAATSLLGAALLWRGRRRAATASSAAPGRRAAP